MKNVTIALDDETHRKARIRAAELGTSLSALVKDYLTSLNDAGETQEVRDMPMAYMAPPAQVVQPDGPPWLVDGKWVYTRDGKPRQPGALRGKIQMADDWDEWPEGFLDAIYGEDTDAAKNWYK
ncbi:hypothetical protein D0Z70_07775 [Sphingobium terrigena]|uniref:Uncharacterized protein n=1 Tax=Sphingobium terrigena TaxID=2304063 RepID=A0A418YUU1_9SPHN|nr:hypothetical protein [Sphingobium terrigena]RJG55920.1 hypothetical protein D0Z70_07775 [Sphingobium terrigena]